MASGNSIGRGALTLSTDTAQLQKGLDDAKKKISGFSLSLGSGLNFFTTGPLGVVLAGLDRFKASVQESGDLAERWLNQSEIYGVTAEKLQALESAAGLAGVATESLGKMLRAAGELAGEASLNSEEAARKLGSLGLDSGEFGKLGPAEALTQILDQLTKVKSKAEQLKLAGDIFGGRNSVDALTLMRSELGKTSEELEGMGAVVDAKLLARLDILADKFTKGSIAAKAFGMTILAEVTKPLSGGLVTADDLYNIEALTKQISKLYEESSRVRVIGNSPAGTFDSLLSKSQIHDAINQLIEYDRKLNTLEARLDMARKNAEIAHLDELDAKAAARTAMIDEKLRAASQALESTIMEGWDQVEKVEKQAAGRFLKDPMSDAMNALMGINVAFETGAIGVEQYGAGLLRLISTLEKTESAANAIQLPGATMAGSAEAAAATQRSIAEGRFGAVGDEGNTQLKEMKDKLEAMKNSTQRQEDLLKKIEKSVQTLQGLKGI